MTSVHHHPSSDVGLHHVPDWVWIGLAALLAVAFGLGIAVTAMVARRVGD